MRQWSTAVVGVCWFLSLLWVAPFATSTTAQQQSGKFLFEQATFGGNGRTCLTCHGHNTGTVSPAEAVQRFTSNPADPLFLQDGSDDGQGTGVTRILAHATIRIEIPLPANVVVDDDPSIRSVILNRGIPTTLNTPALDPVLMYDGREPTLERQALGAIHNHAQNAFEPTPQELAKIADFQRTQEPFFSSDRLLKFAQGGPTPRLPRAVTDSEKRGRRAFENLPFAINTTDGLCATCHSGPMLNQTNEFLPLAVPPGTRFQTVLVSELNAIGNPRRKFVFTNPDGTKRTEFTPDPGRALITGIAQDDGRFDQVNAFKIPSLWGVGRTAPYFHDNSAKTLEQVVEHYARFFAIVTDPDGPGPAPPLILFTEQQKADMLAFLRVIGG